MKSRKHQRRGSDNRKLGAGRQGKLNSLRLMCESLESRLMLASDAFLQGTAFFDGSNLPKANATIELRSSADNYASAITTLTDAKGHYLFDGLDRDRTYRIIEPNSVSYSSIGTQILSQVYAATPISANTIEVKISDKEDFWLTWLDFVRPNNLPNNTVESIKYSLFEGPEQQTAAAQMSDKLGSTLGSSDINAMFQSLCVALNAPISQGNSYQVEIKSTNEITNGASPTPSTISADHAGRIAYLFNHYGSVLLTQNTGGTATNPPGPQLAAGLQVAIWELIYDQATPSHVATTLDLESDNFKITGSGNNNSAAELVAIKNAAVDYLNESIGKSELAIYLDPRSFSQTPQGQGMLALGSFNFRNVSNAPIAPVAKIEIKPDGTNEVGDDHTFTAIVMVDDGYPIGILGADDADGFRPAMDTEVTTLSISLTGSNGAVPAPGGASSGNNNLPVTFTSLSTGIVTGHASAELTVTVGGIDYPLTVQTDGLTDDLDTPSSRDAIKTFVNASIEIDADSTNIVGDPHTFTVTVKEDSGDGLGLQPAAGEIVNAALVLGSVGAITGGTCTIGTTDAFGQCTVVVSSNVVGSADLHVTSSVSVGGIIVPVATTAHDDLSTKDDARKTWIPDSPVINTTPNVTSVTLGTDTVTLKDTAVLSGGYNPQGTLTFTLIVNGNTVATESVPVNGNDTYTTPAGYTLPTNVAVTGTYQWNTTFTSSDANNNDASDIGSPNERVEVSPANPDINTTPNVTTVTLGTTSVLLHDTAQLTGGYNPTGTITFTLYVGATLLHTEDVPVSGNGSYTTLVGYTLPTTGDVTDTYQWNAVYNGDANNGTAEDIDSPNERVEVSPASPAINTTPNVTFVTLGTDTVTLKDTAVLSGGYNPQGTLTFTLIVNGNTVATESVPVNGNDTYTTPVGYTLPTNVAVTGTYQWNTTFVSSNSNNNDASDIDSPNERVEVNPANPDINTIAGGTVVIGSGNKLSDTAFLSGGYNPTGTITFTLYSPSDVPVYTETITVNGNGTYGTVGGYVPVATGVYLWSATYNGDGNNNSVTDDGQNENETVINPDIDIEKYVKIVDQPTCGGEGLTPGFWKTHSTYGPAPLKGWPQTGYSPDQKYETVFGLNAAGQAAVPANPSLLEALGTGGGGVNALMRHSTAALLNASHSNIDYGYTVAQVIALTKAAIESGNETDMENLKNDFDARNNQGADLDTPKCVNNVGGNSGYGSSNPEDPALFVTVGSTVMFTFVVTNPGDVSLQPVVVTDDNATPGVPGDDFLPAPVLDGAFNVGDLDDDNALDPGEIWLYTATATVTAGSFCNTGTATGDYSINQTTDSVEDSDKSCWTTQDPEPDIDIEKTTNATVGPIGGANPIAPDWDNEDTTNGVGVPILTPSSSVTWKYKVTNTGHVPFTLAQVVVTDDNGTPANMLDDIMPIRFVASDVGSDSILSPGEVWTYTATGTVQNLTSSAGPAVTFDMSGSSSTTGTAGNIRTFNAGGVAVNASGFGRTTGGAWSTAFLGSYGGGLGVTDSLDGNGSNNQHTVDNNGSNNYVLFEFSQNVIVDTASLGFVSGDSDLKYWIGTVPGAFGSHQTLSDTFLSNLAFNEENPGGSSNRTADLNSGLVVGNILVIAAKPGETNDYFKIEKLKVQPTTTGTYQNKGTVTVPGAYDSDLSHYKNPLPITTGSLSGKKFADRTGNGKSADDTPLAGTTIYVDLDSDGVKDGGEPFAVTDNNGAYTITGVLAGTHKVREVVPSGMVRTGPELFDYHTVTVVAGQLATSDNGFPGSPAIPAGPIDFYNAEKCDSCVLSNFSFAVTHDGVTKIVSDLRGNTFEGDTVTVTFTVAAGYAPHQFSLVSYVAPSGVWDPNVASQQTIFAVDSKTAGPGTHTLTVTIPKSFYQIDFVCGEAIDKLGPIGSNIFYSNQNRLFSADNSGVNAAGSPAIDLSLTKTVDNANANLGSNVNFTIVVKNAPGWSNATGVVVRDLLPSGYSFVSSTVTKGTYSSGTGNWSVGTLASGASATLTITATVNTSGIKNNAAQVVAADQPDIDSSVNNDSQPTVPRNEDDDDNVSVAPFLWTKFFVVNDGSTTGGDQIYRYAMDGQPNGNSAVNNPAPRGVATTAAATKLWVLDGGTTAEKVFVYNPTGGLLGSWTPKISSSAYLNTPTGIATNGTDVWIVDNGTDKVYKFTNAAGRTSGTQVAASSFSLNKSNKDASDIVFGTLSGTSYLWVVNNVSSGSDKVFRYKLDGSGCVSWTIDAANATPTGITVDPSNVSNIWIVDAGTDRIYQYNAAASLTTGSKSANLTYTLAAGNTNPQGIADPPPSEAGQPMEAAVGSVTAEPASVAAVDAALQILTGSESDNTQKSGRREQPGLVQVRSQSQGMSGAVRTKRLASLNFTEFDLLGVESRETSRGDTDVLIDDLLVDSVLADWHSDARSVALRKWNS